MLNAVAASMSSLAAATSAARASFVAALLGNEYNATCEAMTNVTSVEGSYTICNVLRRPQSENQRVNCHAVSIGIGNVWSLEDALAQAGCIVHAYDPTVELRGVHQAHARESERIHFSFAGVGVSREASTTNNRMKIIQKSHSFYGTLNFSTLVPLDEILRRSYGANGELELLKIDCEGCEWDAFEDLATRAPQALARVNQVIIELHLRNGIRESAVRDEPRPSSGGSGRQLAQASQAFMNIPTSERLELTSVAQNDVQAFLKEHGPGWRRDTGFGLRATQQFDTLMRYLLIDHGFRVVHASVHRGKGNNLRYSRVSPGMAEAGFSPKFCCAELTLIRAPT